MKIHIFGCLSGTEPMPGKHHTAWALEKDGLLYWFDAGDNCANTAHLMGLDVRRIHTIFLSHPHADHTCGLPLLLSVIRKRIVRDPASPEVHVELVTPDLKVIDAARYLMGATEYLPPQFHLKSRIMQPGILLEQNGVRVEALGNHHIEPNPDGSFRSFSFRITAEGKQIIFSGDVRSYHDYEEFLAPGCDLLMMESGHHSPTKLCAVWKEEQRRIGQLLFLHHGREFLGDEAGVKARCEANWGRPVIFARDAMTIEL